MTDKKFVFRKQKNDDYSGAKCFQVDPNLEEKDIPTNGEEYLVKVMKERERCATVTKCDLETSEINEKQGITLDEPSNSEEPDKLKPTIEWQNIQIADFSKLHMYVLRMKARKKAIAPSIFQETYKDFMSDGEVNWRAVFESTDPSLTHVVVLTQPLVETGLEAIFSKLQKVKPGHSIDRRTGLWLHALLTVTRNPPQSEDGFLLRKLCRRCAEIRSHIYLDGENPSELAIPLNIFICIIAKYFGQHDLGDYELHDTKVAQIYYDTKVAQIFYS